MATIKKISSCSLWLGVIALTMSIAENGYAYGIEIPENGTELMGRAGAFVARADNALTTGYNPAGLAGISSSVLLNANWVWQSQCFQRAGSYSRDAVTTGTVFNNNYTNQPYPEVCKLNGFRDANILPQLAVNYSISEKVGIGFSIMPPSTPGRSQWPDVVEINGSIKAPAPQRYLLLTKDVVLLYPTLGVGVEVAKGIRFGAAFQAVMSWISIATMAHSSNVTASDVAESPNGDMRADIKFKNLFTPAFVLGALISPLDDLDIGAMFRWSADLRSTNAEATVEGPYYGNGRSSATQSVQTSAQLKEFVFPQPWELRVGVRWHPQRKESSPVARGTRRDVLNHDQFDLELDLTYSHDRSIDAIRVLFENNTKVAFGTNPSLCCIPPNASVPHQWRDTFGVRLGGEVVAIPKKLGIRGGMFFQSNTQDPAYLNVDFLASMMFGLYIGGTYRVIPNLDLSLGYGHVFMSTLNNENNGKVYGLWATQRPSPGLCDSTNSPDYRSCNPVNSGKTSGNFNMVSLGASYRF